MIHMWRMLWCWKSDLLTDQSDALSSVCTEHEVLRMSRSTAARHPVVACLSSVSHDRRGCLYSRPPLDTQRGLPERVPTNELMYSLIDTRRSLCSVLALDSMLTSCEEIGLHA